MKMVYLAEVAQSNRLCKSTMVARIYLFLLQRVCV